MEQKSTNGSLKLLTSLLLAIAVIHTAFHFTLAGTGINGFGKTGVSGLAVGNLGFGTDIKEKYGQISPLSSIIIIGEWSLLIVLAVFALVHQRSISKKEDIHIEIKNYQKDTSETEIDVLYDILQKKKKLSLTSIEALFKVDKSTVMSWCETLESSDLAKIQYPRMGGPELILEDKSNEKE